MQMWSDSYQKNTVWISEPKHFICRGRGNHFNTPTGRDEEASPPYHHFYLLDLLLIVCGTTESLTFKSDPILRVNLYTSLNPM